MGQADNPVTQHSVLVTGAAGFIGSHLCEALLGAGHDVAGVDCFDPFYDRSAKQRNLDAIAGHARGDAFRFFEADVREPSALRPVFEEARAEGVVHLAAKAGVRPSIADPVGYARTNVLGTAVVLEEARRAGCARIVLASSSSVYGNSEKVPFSETDDVSAPISPYASTKLACEMLARTHHHLTGMPTACLRFFTVYGPRQRPDLAISTFMRRIAAARPITLFGEGTSRDYTFVADTVAGILAAYARIERFGYRVWNLGNSEPVALDEMVRAVAAAVGRAPKIERGPEQPGDVRRTWADPARSAAELGYRPDTPFERGLAAQWAWLAAQPTLG
jgi:UDP-glucuronate 4-epimerase